MPSLFTVSDKPSFEKCATAAIGPNGEKKISKISGSTNECQYQTDFYGNYKPAIIQYNLLALFQVDASHFPRSSYIESSNFGMTDVSLQIILQGVTGNAFDIIILFFDSINYSIISISENHKMISIKYVHLYLFEININTKPSDVNTLII